MGLEDRQGLSWVGLVSGQSSYLQKAMEKHLKPP